MTEKSATTVLLSVESLTVHYSRGWMRTSTAQRQVVRAVEDVSFSVGRRETFGIVGESGSGKTSLGRAIIRLVEPTGGRVVFQGEDMSQMSRLRLREVRSRLQMVFQDTSSSLDPRLTVEEAIREPLDIRNWQRKEATKRVAEVLDDVRMPRSHAKQMPGELSGGQKQRVVIARALALRPELLILDEPVSALDMSVQAQILNLLLDLRDEHGLSYLLIAHDLAVVKQVSDRIGVMYLGKMVEVKPTSTLFTQPEHPYTAGLLSAIPIADPVDERRRMAEEIILEGELPSPVSPPPGCRFHTRCPVAQDKCHLVVPELTENSAGEWAACHFPLLPGESLAHRLAHPLQVDESAPGE